MLEVAYQQLKQREVSWFFSHQVIPSGKDGFDRQRSPKIETNHH